MSKPNERPDELYEFSYRLFKIEYKIIKLVFFALSIYGLYQLVNQHVHISFSSAQTAEPKQETLSGSLGKR